MNPEEQSKPREQTDKMARYRELFSTPEEKAKAFDQIAEHFYVKNFGSMTKTDMETLMFSLYIEQILDEGDENFNTYSDFRLARELGITQSKVRNLKERKQQQYPRNFKWRDAFVRVSKNARYENGKIKIQIPDVNLYYEIQNAVEEAGGFIDVSLTPKLLQISPEYFLDLLIVLTEDERERKKIRKEWQKEFQKHQKDQECLDKEPIGRRMAGAGREVVIDVLSSVLSDIIKDETSISYIGTIAHYIEAILPLK